MIVYSYGTAQASYGASTNDMDDWCKENCNFGWQYFKMKWPKTGDLYIYEFEDEEEATGFKWTWI